MIVDYAIYRDGRRAQEEIPLERTYEASREAGSFAWIGLYEPTP